MRKIGIPSSHFFRVNCQTIVLKNQAQILHLNASNSGGAYVFAENLIKGLDSESAFVSHHACYTGNNNNVKLWPIHALDKAHKFALHAQEKFKLLWHEKDASVRFKFSMGEHGMPLKTLQALCAPYDIIHVHWINKGFIRLEDLATLNKPIVWTCHDAWPVTGGCHLPNTCNHFESGCKQCPLLKNPSEHDLSAQVFKRKSILYPHLNLSLISPSQFMQKQIEHSALGQLSHNTCIPNGIETARFKPSQEYLEGPFSIGFVAANLNDPNKALKRLIETIQLFPKDFDYRLILVGQQKQAFDFELPSNTLLIQDANAADKMHKAYEQMHALVCTSTVETYPTTLMEGFSSGVMGFGFEVGGVPEILKAMQRPAIKAFDTEAMAAALVQYASSLQNRMELHKKARTVFDASQTARAYAAKYAELLNQ